MSLKAKVFFTAEEVVEINPGLITKSGDAAQTKLSPEGRRIVRETQFSADDINKAYAAATKAAK